jgi:nifR3 family TIM-barrel protein
MLSDSDGVLRQDAGVNSTELLAHIKQNPFLLAPMAGITDRPFRSFMRSMGCGAVVSELVSATGLKFSSQKTLRLMEFESSQHPVGIQIFGETLEHLADAGKIIEQMGADFVDINFGCPVPKVVSKGAGSACLKDLVRLRDVVRAVKSAITIPLTIKVRTGWDHDTRNTHEVAQIAYDEGVTWVAIHGRTRAQAYTGLADWDYIAEVKAKSPVPIIGNGDIHFAGKAVDRMRASGCDAVMIGRGCLKNPYIFREARALWAGQEPMGVHEQLRLEHVLEKLREHLETFYDERLTLIQMRKFASWYSAGLPGAAHFRRSVFQSQGREQTLGHIQNYFVSLADQQQADTSSEPFLMGGHG